MILPLILSCLCLLYVSLILVYSYGWQRQPLFTGDNKYIPATRISVIIPARNEAHNIRECITSVIQQDYPKAMLEIIVIDDHSTDETAAIVRLFAQENVKLISLSDYNHYDEGFTSFKKKALDAGIAQSNGALIVTTDADCTASASWLRTIAEVFEKEQAAMIVAPVSFSSDGSLLQVFQSLDFMSMQGITAATHYLKLGIMCNGANLAFSRYAFDAVKGYEGIGHIVSGDDYLLMMKMRQHFPERISYIKSCDAIVTTTPQPDWYSFLQQRIRWASKTGKYEDNKSTGILLLVYLFNISCFCLFFAAFVYPWLFKYCLSMLFIKVLIELFFIYPVAHFFKKKRQLLIFPFLQPLHILYIVIAGFFSFIGKYNWKGRFIKEK